jgi:hypothetical protein
MVRRAARQRQSDAMVSCGGSYTGRLPHSKEGIRVQLFYTGKEATAGQKEGLIGEVTLAWRQLGAFPNLV